VDDFKEKIDLWLIFLESRQSDAATFGFPKGSIPSVRRYPLFGITRNDPNVFFPALIAAKLLEWRSKLTADQTVRADAIVGGIRKTFPAYKSRRGRMHYNFWPTKPDIAFPLGKVLHHFDFFRLPDDIDDTALAYHALAANREAVKALQENIEQHFQQHYANRPKVYAAWLGDKMPWVTDVCAMVNLLSLFKSHGLPPTAYSLESDTFVEQVILEKRYQKTPYKVSPYYPDTAVICYHLTTWALKSADDIRKVLATDLELLYKAETNSFRAMIYEICLMKLGRQIPLSAKLNFTDRDLHFPWFFGSMLSAVHSPTLRRLGKYRVFHIAHICEGWNLTLQMEKLFLEKEKGK